MRIVVVGGSGLAGSQTARALRDGGHEALAEDATGSPKGRARDLAGPEPQDFVDMARRTLTARRPSRRSDRSR